MARSPLGQSLALWAFALEQSSAQLPNFALRTADRLENI